MELQKLRLKVGFKHLKRPAVGIPAVVEQQAPRKPFLGKAERRARNFLQARLAPLYDAGKHGIIGHVRQIILDVVEQKKIGNFRHRKSLRTPSALWS